MNDNINKLYELAGVELEYYTFHSADGNIYKWEINENGNDKYNMHFIGAPQKEKRIFTDSKQLELIKWLMLYPMTDELSLYFHESSQTYNFNMYYVPEIRGCRDSRTECNADFTQALAGLIINLWNNLSDEQRDSIKEILE